MSDPGVIAGHARVKFAPKVADVMSGDALATKQHQACRRAGRERTRLRARVRADGNQASGPHLARGSRVRQLALKD